MRILIAGAGTIGTNLAAALTKEGQDVIVVDPDEQRLASIETTVDCQCQIASATSPLQLEEIGIRHTDLVLAVTQDDARNMTICGLADFYKVPQKIARVRNAEFTDDLCPIPPEHFGIDQFISPEGITVRHIQNLINCPGATEAVDFERGQINLRAIAVNEESEVAGEKIIDVHKQLGGNFLMAAISRGSHVFIPQGQETLRIGDTVYIVCAPERLSQLITAFNPFASTAKRVLVFGAGVTGLQLCRRLASQIERVTLIEPDLNKAHQAADQLDEAGVEVLHGSALDEHLLNRIHAESSDFFVAVRENDEENLMSALLYRRYGNGTPIVLTSQEHYIDILESVDLDIVINPRLLAVSSILRHIRGEGVVSVAKLRREGAEVLELRAKPKSPICKDVIARLGLPQIGLLVVAVMRDGHLHIPTGLFRIQTDDRVLLFADQNGVKEISRLFKL